MSQSKDDHWREVPKDRTNPEHPPNLTERYEHFEYEDVTDPERQDKTIVYDSTKPDKRWVQGMAMPLDSML